MTLKFYASFIDLSEDGQISKIKVSTVTLKLELVEMSRKSVCIIGAGPCGIFAAKTIGEVADVVVYERSSVFGGQWVS